MGLSNTRIRRHREQSAAGGVDISIDEPGRIGAAGGPLRLLASAVAGRSVSVVHDATSVVHTDGTTIFLPEPGSPDEIRDAVTAVCVQAAMIGAGSLHQPALRRVLMRKGAMPRYVTLEAGRAVELLHQVLPSSVVSVVRAHWAADLPEGPDASAEQAVRRRAVPDAPASFGTLRRAALSAPQAAIGKDLEGDELPEVEEPADDADGKKPEKSAVMMPALLDNAFTRMMKEILGSEGSSAAGDADNGGMETAVRSAVRMSRLSATARPIAARVARMLASAPDPNGIAYPEWDFRAGAHRPDWCSVLEVDPAPQPDCEPTHVPSNRPLLRAAVRITTARERHNRQSTGDALDLAALVGFEVTRRAGDTPDGRVFQDRLPTASDLSVLLLLDCSGSAAETAGAQPIWEHQRLIAAQFLAAFAAAGARVGAYGFSSHGRTLQFLHIKAFDDGYAGPARQRLACLQPSGYTRMGAAIRHATHLLRTSGGTGRSLLVVISDGLPYDDDYEGAYAEQDTRHALEEAAARGVGCACFTVESPTNPSALERLWGSATYVQLTTGRRWSAPVEAALRSAMRTAASTSRITT
jgi:nitric oxide reductase NorD protein